MMVRLENFDVSSEVAVNERMNFGQMKPLMGSISCMIV